ncbi:MATE family efflux transporter [Bacilliculturomica massiliensis]|uniref:MATE family efflux transporter n=1 Tax=Bacilliculturomica massiliensis TaxID=1917867 RepID=UPI001031A972|nr:MATE family efflux transporter [Bacilliculturomica massiliensis]
MEQEKTKQITEKGLMTEGVIYKQLLLFALPLILGNLFQQLYNMVDSIVVGNFIGGTALAAVGAGFAVINLLIGLFMGLTTGAGVVISQFYGAGDTEKLRQAVHTAAAFTLIFGVFLSVAGVLLADHILIWTNTPPEVFDQASVYLRIFFSGMIFLSIYNMGAAVLRAVGDSKTPLYYLGVACIINIILDILLVAVIGMDVEGVAIATLIAQAVAALMVVVKLVRCREGYGLVLKEIRIHPLRLKRILIVGIPSGIQQMIISLSNVVVQGYINGFGSDAMAGWSAYSKIDGLLLLPLLSFGLAMTTFTGQNIGAKKLDRIHKGVHSCLIMSTTFAAVMTVAMYIFGGPVLSIFSDEPEVLRYGVYMLKGMIPFYFLLGFIQIFSGVISGSGNSFASMLIMVSNMCVLRVAALWFMASRISDVKFVFYAYVLSWATCAAGLFLYYLKGSWKKGIAGKDGVPEDGADVL